MSLRRLVFWWPAIILGFCFAFPAFKQLIDAMAKADPEHYKQVTIAFLAGMGLLLFSFAAAMPTGKQLVLDPIIKGLAKAGTLADEALYLARMANGEWIVVYWSSASGSFESADRAFDDDEILSLYYLTPEGAPQNHVLN